MSLIKDSGSGPGAARKILQRSRKVTKHDTGNVKSYSVSVAVLVHVFGAVD